MSKRKGRDIGIGRPDESVTLYTSRIVVVDRVGIAVTNFDQVLSWSRLIGEGDSEQGLFKVPHHGGPAQPPGLGQSLVTLLLSGQRREAVLGDLDELLKRDRDRYGLRRAQVLYTMRALQFIWPVLRRAIARLIGWGAVAEAARRFFSGG
jgi:hypothetical protein